MEMIYVTLGIVVVIGIYWLIALALYPTVPKSNYTVVNGVRCKYDDKYYIINTNETEICPFCKSTKIFSGSWAPECCENCGTSHMLGVWLKDKK